MNNSAALHSKGWAGLSFIILVVAQAVLAGLSQPPAHADAAAVDAYLATHAHALLISAWLALPITGFFLWFDVGISRYLRDHGREDDGLPTFVLICGVTIAAVYMLWQAVMACLVFAGAALAPAGTMFWWSLQVLVGNVFLAVPSMFFIYGVAHSMRRHESAPWWLAWLGYLAALGQAVMTFGVFSSSGIPGNSMLLFVLAFILFVLWTICTAGYLVMLPGKEAAAVVSAA